MRHYKITAKGKVQGVGYRNFTKKYADSKNLIGNVCNLSNGNVEIYVTFSNDSVANLSEFLESLHKGNGRMQTKSFEIEILDSIPYDFKASGFEIIE